MNPPRLRLTTRIGLTFIIVALYAIFSTLSAQRPGGGPGGPGQHRTPEERAQRQTERMKDQLKLTPAQEPKVYAINLKYAKKMESSMNVRDTAAQRKEFTAMNRQKETEMKGILTPDQMKSFQRMQQEMMARLRPVKR